MKDHHKIPPAGNKGLPRALPIIFAVAIALGGCVASQQDVRSLDLRLRTLNNRLDDVDRNIDDLQQQTSRRAEKNAVEDLQKNLAKSSADLDRLHSEIMKLKGNLEEVAHRSTVNREENQDYLNDLGKRLAQAEKRLDALSKSGSATEKNSRATEKRVATIETEMNNLTAQLNSRFEAINKAINDLGQETTAIRGLIQKMKEENARRAAEAAARAAREAEEKARRARIPKKITPRKNKKRPNHKATKAAPVTAAAAAKTVEKATAKAADPTARLYAEGQTAFKAGKYREAYAKFSSYLEKYPKSTLAGNARFWLGDCLYQQEEYALAILEYQKVVDDYRNHPKTPAALLKQGLAFEKLADRKTAKIVYLKLLKLYPGRPEADLAKKRLDAIG